MWQERVKIDASMADKPGVGFVASACALVLITLAASLSSAQVEMYTEATVDKSGQLRITTKDGREITPKKKSDQVGFDVAKISPDGRTVGWVALFPNCCTSYPIPLGLVLYSSGKMRVFTGSRLPIWRWCFEDEGRRVAFEQETVHGGIGIHYELRDVASGKLVAEYDPPVGRDNISRETPKDDPKWVAELNANE